MSEMSLEEMADKLRDAGYKVQPPGNHCQLCSRPATWVRHTDYAGDQLFCQRHAEREEYFGSTAHGVYWIEINGLGL